MTILHCVADLTLPLCHPLELTDCCSGVGGSCRGLTFVVVVVVAA